MEGRPKHLMLAQVAAASLARFDFPVGARLGALPAGRRDPDIHERRNGYKKNNRRYAGGAYKGSPTAKRATKRGGNPAVYG